MYLETNVFPDGLPDFRLETVTPTRQGLDINMMLGSIAESFSQHRDIESDVALFNEHIRPECLEDFLLGDDRTVVLYQQQQGLKDFWRQRYYPSITLQDSLIHVQNVGIEAVNVPESNCHSSLASL